MTRLEQLMEENQYTPTLKALAMVFDIPPVRLYNVAKQPKDGEVYDAKVFNWEAVEKFLERRLDEERGIGSLDDVFAKAVENDEQLKANDKRRGKKVELGSVEVDGKMIPVRKYSSFEDENTPIVLRGDGNVYGIVFQTVSHTVLVPVNQSMERVSETVKVISNVMLNLKGVSPATLDTALKQRGWDR